MGYVKFKIKFINQFAKYENIKRRISLFKSALEIENLYKLRCGFSAHPAHSKWWDFSEIYEGDIEEIMYSVKSTVIKFLMFERDNRKIEKVPFCWSDWFMDNCDIIYDAVRFHKLPILN